MFSLSLRSLYLPWGHKVTLLNYLLEILLFLLSHLEWNMPRIDFYVGISFLFSFFFMSSHLPKSIYKKDHSLLTELFLWSHSIFYFLGVSIWSRVYKFNFDSRTLKHFNPTNFLPNLCIVIIVFYEYFKLRYTLLLFLYIVDTNLDVSSRFSIFIIHSFLYLWSIWDHFSIAWQTLSVSIY